MFRNKVVTYLGNISYSLYLWHWPIYVISLYYELNGRIRHKIFFILLSLLGAVISYHFIEKRDFRKYSKQIIITSVVCFGVFFGINYINPELLYKDNKISNLAHYASNYKYSDFAEKQYNFPEKHFLHTQKFAEWNKNVLKIDSSKKNIMLLGDSHAGMFAQSLEELAIKYDFNLIQATADATYPMINSKTNYPECQTYFNYIFKEFIPKNYKNIDLVIINSNYVSYSESDIINKINWTENFFRGLTIKTIYIGQNKTYNIDFPTATYLNQNALNDYKNIDNLLTKRLMNKYVNLNKLNIREVSSHGVPYTMDQSHLTKYGTDQYLNLISTKILSDFYTVKN